MNSTIMVLDSLNRDPSDSDSRCVMELVMVRCTTYHFATTYVSALPCVLLAGLHTCTSSNTQPSRNLQHTPRETKQACVRMCVSVTRMVGPFSSLSYMMWMGGQAWW